MILSYVDPGQGFVFAQNGLFIGSFLFGLAGGILFFFRFFFGFIKKFFWIIIAVLIVIGAIWGVNMMGSRTFPKVIVIGVDAMDPKITESLLEEGKLPNFARLRDAGSFSRLSTTVPSESAVAWTSFYTGLMPGNHGIFDFVMRDPATYEPYLSLNEVSNAGGSPVAKIRSNGKPFWNALAARHVPCKVFFCPNTFPPEEVKGTYISGMGVPDITGTMGRSTFYSSKPDLPKTGRQVRMMSVDVKNGEASTVVPGPRIVRAGKQEESSVPLRITLLPGQDAVQITVDGKGFVLKKGSWSEWKPVTFPVGFLKKVNGIVTFNLVSVRPYLELYASPVNFDPRNPPLPISYPHGYARSLAGKIGLFHTQGMPHDTWALSEGLLDEEAFLGMTDIILSERERILRAELKKFDKGFFFFYFDTLDAIQHMFWRYCDPDNPAAGADARYRHTIEGYYKKIDHILGEVVDAAGKDAVVIVISDHGFSSFRRSFDLNRWLIDNGYLYLKSGAITADGLLENIDWTRTKAYALGFGGIYLNQSGREYYGIVGPDVRDALLAHITEQLSGIIDPVTGRKPVRSVYRGDAVFSGLRRNLAPDLLVGFDKGYRGSWQTALGGAGSALFQENAKKWSGDHLVDPLLVPGVVFVNRKADMGTPSIVDCAQTILALFECNEWKTDGKDFLEKSRGRSDSGRR